MLIENYYISEKKDNYDASMMINVLPRYLCIEKINIDEFVDIQYFDGK